MPLSRRALVLAAASFLAVSLAHADAPATPDEAKALAERAAAHLKAVGLDKAIADFLDPKAGYIDRELFVIVYSPEGKVLCGYGVPALTGRDGTQLKDVNGKEFGKEIMTIGQNGGTGWVEYRMTNPLTKKVGLKRSYVIGVDGYTVFVGAYAS